MLLTLIVVPCAYLIVHRGAAALKRFVIGGQRSAADPELARSSGD